MKKPLKTVLSVLTVSLILAACQDESQSNYTQFVDPYIGSGGHGHVFIGANVPNGFVQLGPSQRTQGWDWCSGYNYSDSLLVGFGHLHLSGTGVGDLGDITFLPVTGEVEIGEGNANEDITSGSCTTFSHDNEIVRPGYYSVHLDRYGVDAELTATARCGFHRYTYPEGADAGMVIDLNHGIGGDRTLECNLVLEDSRTVSGYRKSAGWAKFQQVYFTATFSKDIENMKIFAPYVNDVKATGERRARVSFEQVAGDSLTAQSLYGKLTFDTSDNEPLYVKVGLSAVSVENAKENLATELPDASKFDATVKDADRLWNERLGRIDYQSGNEEQKRIFYTSLYHTLIAPSIFCDVNGDYRGSDGEVYNDKTYTNLTTFSLWDIYRAANPLMTLIEPDLSRDAAKSMVNISKQQGFMPVWPLMGNETFCMPGNAGICVVADMIMKGLVEDEQGAYQEMKKSSMLDQRGLDALKEYDYIPYESIGESVAKCMEYAIADWSLAQVADRLGYAEDYEYFLDRSKSYHHYFDKTTGFMRGLSKDGTTFKEPFDPFASSEPDKVYTEGNAWQYIWLAPHDVEGLVGLFGSKDNFLTKLDSLFIAEGDLGDSAADMTGLIGQYAHGNEPSHHIPYLYCYVGEQYKTAEKVREIMTSMYDNTPEGLCGNEDVGQMSAWYIMSAMGLYQIAPASGQYLFGSPLMDKAVLDVGGGKRFTIVATNNSPENMYVQNVKLNGKDHPAPFVTFDEIVSGGELEFIMGAEPSDFGKGGLM